MGFDLSGLKLIKQVKEDLARAVFFACQEYANGGFRAERADAREAGCGAGGFCVDWAHV